MECLVQDALKVIALLAAGLATFVFLLPPASAASAGTAPLTMKQLLFGDATSSLVQNAQADRCRRANNICGYRFGVGRDYRRCMHRRGCR